LEAVDDEIQQVLDELRLVMKQQQNQSLSSYCDESSKKIQRLKMIGCELNEKKISVQFLIGLDQPTFGTVVGQWLPTKTADIEKFQSTFCSFYV
jgi:hypothetical protein